MQYRDKESWPTTIGVPCLHCNGPIKHRPCTVGLTQHSGTIETRGFFCNWLCVRTYMDECRLCLNESAMRCTNIIFQEFKKKIDVFDDHDHYDTVKDCEDFVEVRVSTPRHEMTYWGGSVDSSPVSSPAGRKKRGALAEKLGLSA